MMWASALTLTSGTYTDILDHQLRQTLRGISSHLLRRPIRILVGMKATGGIRRVESRSWCSTLRLMRKSDSLGTVRGQAPKRVLRSQ